MKMRRPLNLIDIRSIYLFIFIFSISVDFLRSESNFKDFCNTTSGLYRLDENDKCSTIFLRCDDKQKLGIEKCPAGHVFNGNSCIPAPPECEDIVTQGRLANRTCDIDEVYLQCGSPCPKRCPSLESFDVECDHRCVTGCFCKDGFVRDENGKCILEEDCVKERVPRTGDIFRCKEAGGDHASTVLLCSNTFYRCNNWQPKKMYCGEGDIFDSDTRRCRPLDELPQCQFDCSDKKHPSTHALGCTPYHWWCWNGVASKVKCTQADRYFNPDNEQCDFRSNVRACDGKPDYIETPGIGQKPRATRPPRPSTTTAAPGSGPIKHPVDCSILKDGNYPNPLEPCSDHYYMCSNHATFRSPCAAMLYYNVKTNACQYRKEVPACNELMDQPASEKPPSDVKQPALALPVIEKPQVLPSAPLYSQQPGSSANQLTFDCANKADGNYQDPVESCAGYYYTCSNKLASYHSCPPSLYYHAQADQCRRWIEVPACGSIGNPTPNGPTAAPATAPPPTPASETGYGNPNVPNPAQSQSIDCSNLRDGNYANPTASCSNFYFSCTNGYSIHRPCPNDLFYDDGYDRCLHRSEVPACGGSRPVTLSPLEYGPSMCPKPDGIFPHPHYRCNRAYVICKDNKFSIAHCENSRYIFDPVTGSCSDPRSVRGCDTDFCLGKEDGGRYQTPDQQCASTFIVCVHGVAVYQPCPMPLIFSSSTGNCEWAADVPGCGSSKPIEENRGYGQNQVVPQPYPRPDQPYGGQINPNPTLPPLPPLPPVPPMPAVDYRPSYPYQPAPPAPLPPSPLGTQRPMPPPTSNYDQLQIYGQFFNKPKPVPAQSASQKKPEDAICADKSNGWKLALAKCNNFYGECRHGQWKIMQCPDGHLFDRLLGKCHLSTLVRECSDEIGRPEPTPSYRSKIDPKQPDLDFCDGKRDGNYLKADCDSEFYHCLNGRTLFGNCRLSRHVFDADKGKCVPAAIVRACFGRHHHGKYGHQHRHHGHHDRHSRPLVVENESHGREFGEKFGGQSHENRWGHGKGHENRWDHGKDHENDDDHGKSHENRWDHGKDHENRRDHGKDHENRWDHGKGRESHGDHGKDHENHDDHEKSVERPWDHRRSNEHHATPDHEYGRPLDRVWSRELSRSDEFFDRSSSDEIIDADRSISDEWDRDRSSISDEVVVVDRSDSESGDWDWSDEHRCNGRHEIFKECGSCQPTCRNPRPFCSEKHCKKGCACKDGYVRARSGRCVRRNFCDSEHRRHRNRDESSELKDGHRCDDGHGHRCNRGKLRSSEEDKCPGENEIFSKCRAWCQPTCSKKDVDCNDGKKCVPGCICIPGAYRSHTGVCVKEENCFDVPPPNKDEKDEEKEKKDETPVTETELTSVEEKFNEFCQGKSDGTHKLGQCSSTYIHCKNQLAHMLKCKGCQIFNGDRCVNCRSVRKCRNKCSKVADCHRRDDREGKERHGRRDRDRDCDRSSHGRCKSGKDHFESHDRRQHRRGGRHDFSNDRSGHRRHDKSHEFGHGHGHGHGYRSGSGSREFGRHFGHRRGSHSGSHEFGHRFGRGYGSWSGSHEFGHRVSPFWARHRFSNEYDGDFRFGSGESREFDFRYFWNHGVHHCRDRSDGEYELFPCHRSYVRCFHGRPLFRRCEHGSIFDSIRHTCILESHSNCGGDRSSSFENVGFPFLRYHTPEHLQEYTRGGHDNTTDVTPAPFGPRPTPSIPQDYEHRGYNSGEWRRKFNGHSANPGGYEHRGYNSGEWRRKFNGHSASPGGYEHRGYNSGEWHRKFNGHFGHGRYPPFGHHHRHHGGHYPFDQHHKFNFPYVHNQIDDRKPDFNGHVPKKPEPQSRVLVDVDGPCRGLVDGSFISFGKCKREYAQCLNGVAVPRICKHTRQIYDDVTRQCIDRQDEPLCRAMPPLPKPTRPTGELANFCVDKADDYYRHPTNCSKFVQCHRKDTFIFQCSTGLVFNATAKACDYPTNVPECNAQEVAGYDRECQGLPDGAFLRHPFDCRKFRRCVHGRIYTQDCPAPTVFNHRLNVCDYVDNVPECKKYR